ncbi:hypothetical protein B0A49_01248 [Cryomyces minteri]|uniref:Uncharacterized protein n=1 Tax=Cryomyces minteri TaxID=331657 RepID=A0A4U0XN16_9PEZI|nr:hypothetical protein B0A49_01248 [Cryomyces minteri]
MSGTLLSYRDDVPPPEGRIVEMMLYRLQHRTNRVRAAQSEEPDNTPTPNRVPPAWQREKEAPCRQQKKKAPRVQQTTNNNAEEEVTGNAGAQIPDTSLVPYKQQLQTTQALVIQEQSFTSIKDAIIWAKTLDVVTRQDVMEELMGALETYQEGAEDAVSDLGSRMFAEAAKRGRKYEEEMRAKFWSADQTIKSSKQVASSHAHDSHRVETAAREPDVPRGSSQSAAQTAVPISARHATVVWVASPLQHATQRNSSACSVAKTGGPIAVEGLARGRRLRYRGLAVDAEGREVGRCEDGGQEKGRETSSSLALMLDRSRVVGEEAEAEGDVGRVRYWKVDENGDTKSRKMSGREEAEDAKETRENANFEVS